MAESVEHPVYEHLKRFQVTRDGSGRQLGQFSDRMAAIDQDGAAMSRQFGQLAAVRIARQNAFDDLNRRLERIEQQLGLSS